MVLRNKLTKEILSPFPAQPCEQVEGLLKTSVQAWEASDACKQLRSTLASRINNIGGVSKVVGIACGEISPGEQDEMAVRSSFQHALLLTMRDILAKPNSGSATCYAQDPAYTDVDKSVLEQFGITTVDDPEAFILLDNSTAVFSSAPDVPVRQIVSDLAQPAVMIWNKGEKDEIEAARDGVFL